ncbi:hypothetical protein EJD96_21990 [Herbaspirillum seropedicae]|uniref:hypothetical protein n=1 Tax=Herbaspirillum seropedicae TaxID=964 RepID=UPI00111F7697|nr:hypothetical protein [Herbaspirillum seropedicae]QDD66645.1 hypothetical protein EJD96_21990 [Herbaspirillum seropedicae]
MEERKLQIIFPKTGNWNLRDRHGNEGIYRVLGEIGPQIFVVKIGYIDNKKFIRYPTPETHIRRDVWRRDTAERNLAKGHLIHIDDKGIPAPMENAIAPEDGFDLAYDRRRAAVVSIEELWGLEILNKKTGRAAYSAAMSSTARRFHTDVQSVKKWYERYLFYGRHRNANISEDWSKGGPDISRRGLKYEDGTYVPRGKKTTKQKEMGDGIERRGLLSKALLREYSTFIKTRVWGAPEDKFPKIYKDFKTSRYAFNRNKDGEKVAYLIKLDHLPKDKYLKDVGRKIFSEAKADREVARQIADQFRPSLAPGSAGELVSDQIPVLDIDATSFSNGVLFPDLPDAVLAHGKPTVYLGIDRGSGAIVGYYVTFEPENGRGYKACMFSCYLSKERDLLHWGVPYLKGFVHGCTAKVFFDRGAGISKDVKDFMERLRANMVIAAPYRPKTKGHVEGGMHIAQGGLADLEGSTFTTGDPETDKEHRKKAKLKAVSLMKFMQSLLKCISEHNLQVNKTYQLSPNMLLNGVVPCPADIYWYNKGRIRGDAAQQWLWPEEKIFRMLCEEHSCVASEGVVTIKGTRLSFTSDALTAHAIRHHARHKEYPTVTIYQLPHSTEHALWDQPNGTLTKLIATPKTVFAYEDGTKLTIEASNKKRNSLAYDGHERARKIEQQALNQTAGGVSKATMKAVKKVDSKATGYMLPPSDEMKKDAAASLNATNFDNVVSGIVSDPGVQPQPKTLASSLFRSRKGQRLVHDITK